MARWGLVTQKRENGGLGVLDLRNMNICLLASWIKRYHLDGSKLWKRIVDFKYNAEAPTFSAALRTSALLFGRE